MRRLLFARPTVGLLAGGAILAFLALVSFLSLQGGGNEAEARHGPGTGNVVVGFDMNTTNTGTAGVGGGMEGREDGVRQACNDGIDNGGLGDGIDGADTDCQSKGNASTSLGPIDDCVEVSAGTTITFDVFIDGIPVTAPTLAGFGYNIQFPEAAGAIIETQVHASPGLTILQPTVPLSQFLPHPPGGGTNFDEHTVSEARFFNQPPHPIVPNVA